MLGKGKVCNATGNVHSREALCGRGLACRAGKCERAPRVGDPCGVAGACEWGSACVGADGVQTTGVGMTLMGPMMTCVDGTKCNNFPGRRGSRECVSPKRAGESCTRRYPCSTQGSLKCVRSVESLENDSVPAYAKTGECMVVLLEGGACEGWGIAAAGWEFDARVVSV